MDERVLQQNKNSIKPSSSFETMPVSHRSMVPHHNLGVYVSRKLRWRQVRSSSNVTVVQPIISLFDSSSYLIYRKASTLHFEHQQAFIQTIEIKTYLSPPAPLSNPIHTFKKTYPTYV